VRRRVLLATPALVLPARAQPAWPSRGVSIVVPFAPGSSSDIVGRASAQQMQQALGKPFVVENRPGASGELGARQVIRSPPDGHVLMHGPISVWAINVALRPNLGYDPTKDLTRITQTVRTPNVLVVNPRLVPATDLAGVVEWLKRSPGAAYSSSGVGSSDHLTMEMLKLALGVDAAHAPYTGGGPAMTSVIAGDTQLSFQNLGSVLPQIQDGRLRAILTTAATRPAVLAEVPTAVEAGVRDFVVYSWQAYGGPPGMEPGLLREVHAAITGALRAPAVASRMNGLGFEVVAGTPEEFADFQAGEIARWRDVVRRGNIRAE
jgi:tripartite-type tricarboxylate transporter receptor subunit TctC